MQRSNDSIVLTKKQSKGLDIAIQRYKDGEKYTVISGYAGSGKSTLVKYIIAALSNFDINPDKDVVYTAYTGKACTVLQQKGNANVLTLCKLLYDYKLLPTGSYIRKPKSTIPYKIVVVDEVSMAPTELMQQLAKHNCYIICLGDPGQLPPILADDNNHLLDKPHIFLDEIMRQAQESEIIRISMDIREGRPLQYHRGEEVCIYPKSDISQGMLSWADQILVATNKTRHFYNTEMRKILGKEGEPQNDDKIIFLRNDWDILSDKETPIVNGTIGYLKNPVISGFQIPKWAGPERYVSMLISKIKTESNETYQNLDLDYKMLQTGKPGISWKTKYRLNRNKRVCYPNPLEIAYGYAITVHKAQGSSWGKVLVVEENFPTVREEHKRWLYTAVTRAEDKLVLIK